MPCHLYELVKIKPSSAKKKHRPHAHFIDYSLLLILLLCACICLSRVQKQIIHQDSYFVFLHRMKLL